MTIRPATREDAEVVCAHRRAMFSDMGHRDTAAINDMAAQFLPWVERRLASGEYLAWFVVAPDESVVAGVGIWLMDWPPHMAGPGKPRANILNVYTQLEYRRQGLARRLMERALDWCRTREIKTVILHASEEGRGLYESLGFRATNEMRLAL